MRPVKKGNKPNNLNITHYKYARASLIHRIGAYCSYCERYIPASLAVEHVKPKDLYPLEKLDWNNFLLACINCNSTKKDKQINLNDYFWPHMDNTMIPFRYNSYGLISINSRISIIQKTMAENTIMLVGLNKKPHSSDKIVSNRLWKQRKETWNKAKTHKKRLSMTRDRIQMMDSIVDNAIDKGFFSVWIEVFKNDPIMIDKLIKKFRGTAIDITNIRNERTDYRTLLV